MKRVVLWLVTLSMVLAACGGSTADTASDPVAATDAPAETSAPATPTTEAPESETTEAPAPEEAEETEEAGAVAVSLGDFTIETDATFSAGPVTFDVVNDGNFPHEFGIAKGNSYEELPLTTAGGIDEGVLGADNLGKTGVLNGGETETISFDLEPGTYVFYCNIGATSPNSHAAKGQVLTVTVN